MKKVAGILGSPREGGNTEILLDEALKGANSTGAIVEKISLGGLEFKGCIECGGCYQTGECVLRDDLTPVYEKVRNADVVILASPIFFAGVTAQLKAMIDRFQTEWVCKYLLRRRTKDDGRWMNRKGAFICVGGHKDKKFYEPAKATVDIFFKTLDIDFSEELFFGGVEKAGDIRAVKGALQKAFKLGQHIVEAGLKPAPTRQRIAKGG